MGRYAVRNADLGDVERLLELARSVEHLFGPMVEHGFEETIRSNIQREALLVAVDNNPQNGLAGGLIFDVREAPRYHIRWFAVFEASRGTGAGRMLLSTALQKAVAPCSVELTTFGADIQAGIPARRLYESFGFRAGAMLARGPEGGTRQQFTMELSH